MRCGLVVETGEVREVAHFALGADAVRLRHHGGFLLELVVLLLQRLLLCGDVALPRQELGLERSLGGLGLRGLLEQAAEVDEADLERLRPGRRRTRKGGRDDQSAGSDVPGHVSHLASIVRMRTRS